jgi:hypothetical protein
MRSTSKVIEQSGIEPSLIRSVVRQLGDKESFRDIVRGGIDGGFHGFIYHADTVSFFKRNREAIADLVRRYADDFGSDPVSVVAGFRCLTDDAETRESIARCLFGGRLREEDTEIANALAWFAGEEVARAFADE